MVKIYLAARYGRREELRVIARKLEDLGHIITSRWIWTEWEANCEGSAAAPPEDRERFAAIDMYDVKNADCVISFTEEPRSNSRGGRHVEFGMALAWRKLNIVIGPHEHIFHHHETVKHFNTIEEALEIL